MKDPDRVITIHTEQGPVALTPGDSGDKAAFIAVILEFDKRIKELQREVVALRMGKRKIGLT